jgi:hypothetical protein
MDMHTAKAIRMRQSSPIRCTTDGGRRIQRTRVPRAARGWGRAIAVAHAHVPGRRRHAGPGGIGIGIEDDLLYIRMLTRVHSPLMIGMVLGF